MYAQYLLLHQHRTSILLKCESNEETLLSLILHFMQPHRIAWW